MLRARWNIHGQDLPLEKEYKITKAKLVMYMKLRKEITKVSSYLPKKLGKLEPKCPYYYQARDVRGTSHDHPLENCFFS